MNKNSSLKKSSNIGENVDIPDNQGERALCSQEKNNLSTAIVDKFAKAMKLENYGITTPKISAKYIDYYKEWLNSKHNAHMKWMEKNIEVHGNIELKFPWAKSVVVFADNYYMAKAWDQKALKISRYAWGQDYHQVLLKKIKQVLVLLKQMDETTDGKVYVDTGPFLEKCYAIESGLGWMGKNSQIFVPGVGSYVFLGLLILNKEFETYGEPIDPQCNSCTKCIKACPTGAIVNERRIDSNKCISYFSIEKKGQLIDNEKKVMKDWLYGCDICQDICPWNKKWARTSKEDKYYDKAELIIRSAAEWEELSENEFNKLFQKSVFKRLKYERFRRNLLANIDNI